jgi:hypothetical protein
MNRLYEGTIKQRFATEDSPHKDEGTY